MRGVERTDVCPHPLAACTPLLSLSNSLSLHFFSPKRVFARKCHIQEAILVLVVVVDVRHESG